MALRDSPEVKILEFSQQDIFSRNLIWVSSSSREESARGGFSFQVSDGVHLAEMKRFIIEMRRLDINLELNAKFKCYPNEKTKITKFDFWGETNDKAGFQILFSHLSELRAFMKSLNRLGIVQLIFRSIDGPKMATYWTNMAMKSLILPSGILLMAIFGSIQLETFPNGQQWIFSHFQHRRGRHELLTDHSIFK